MYSQHTFAAVPLLASSSELPLMKEDECTGACESITDVDKMNKSDNGTSIIISDKNKMIHCIIYNMIITDKSFTHNNWMEFDSSKACENKLSKIDRVT